MPAASGCRAWSARGVALEILLTGDMISAQRAYEIGLVNRVVPAAELLAEAKKLAHTLASKAPIAVRYILEAVHQGLDGPLAAGQFLETALFGAIASSDGHEGRHEGVSREAQGRLARRSEHAE